MRLFSSSLFVACSLFLLSFVTAAGQDSSSSAAVRLLPKNVGNFRAQAVRPLPAKEGEVESFGVRAAAEGVYVSSKGERMTVLVMTTQSHTGAYSFLTRAATQMKATTQSGAVTLSGVGVAGIGSAQEVVFYKGPVFVSITGKGNNADNNPASFARAFAATLPEAENEIPVLVKHLPDWETAQERALYAISLPALQAATGEQPVFEAINFKEGAEAVTATYDASRLVIVEYTTPQIAADTDARIMARLQELRAGGQSVPSSYRRVGNYSVFVFNAPDETVAVQLIDRVKWEQKIQWLGENPLLWARAEKQHTQEAIGLILGIAKTIGFFVMVCLGVGAIFGGFFFMRRKAQQRALEATEAYSDAGGMLRLNIDEMTREPDPARLLGTGEEKPVAR